MNIYEVDRNGLVFITSKESKYKTNWEVFDVVQCYVDEIEYGYYIFSQWSSTNSETLNPVEIWIKGTNPIESLSFEARSSLTFKHPPCVLSKLFPCVHPGMNLLLLSYFKRIFLWDQLAGQAPKGMSIHSISFIYPQYFNFKFKIMTHFVWYLLLNYQQ